jgi:hypothetical protein
MIRRPEWRQPNPQMQLIAVLAALEGTTSNLLNGVYGPERLADIKERCADLYEQVRELNSVNCRSWESFQIFKQP